MAKYGGMGPRPKYCGERECYDRSYDRKRQEAKAVVKTEAVQLAVLMEGKRIWQVMLRKVASVVGTTTRTGPRITEPLPRGGTLIILSRSERDEVLGQVAELDKAVRRAVDALKVSRKPAYRAVARDLVNRRKILDLLGHEYLLSEIPQQPKGPAR